MRIFHGRCDFQQFFSPPTELTSLSPAFLHCVFTSDDRLRGWRRWHTDERELFDYSHSLTVCVCTETGSVHACARWEGGCVWFIHQCVCSCCAVIAAVALLPQRKWCWSDLWPWRLQGCERGVRRGGDKEKALCGSVGQLLFVLSHKFDVTSPPQNTVQIQLLGWQIHF